MTWLALILLLAAGTADAAPRRAGGAMSRVEESAGGRFSAVVPRGWRVSKDDDAIQAKAPSGAPPASVSVVFYAQGGPYFADAEAFLNRQTAASPVPVAGEKVGKVEPAALAGRPAKRLRRDTFVVHRPPAAEPVEVAVREETLVLQGKEGFWVLTLTAPSAEWDKHAAAFKAFRDGFKPKGGF